MQNRSGLVGFSYPTVQESPAIATEGRDIELQESAKLLLYRRLLRSDKSTTEDPTTSTGHSVRYYHHIDRRVLPTTTAAKSQEW
jgi:hypothetical protein